MKIIKKHMKPGEYFQEKYTKHQIVLHHTESNTWKSAWNWWNNQPGHIGAAYLIDKDGTIIECFDPADWAYHTGTGKVYDKHSIAIEIVNEGYLEKKDNEKYYWFNGKYRYTGKPYKLNMPWKGHKYFASYTTQQIQATKKLCKMLCHDFNIHTDVISGFDFHPNYKTQEGIIIHANVKDTKTDLSPAFPLMDLQEYLNSPIVNIPTKQSTPLTYVKPKRKKNIFRDLTIKRWFKV